MRCEYQSWMSGDFLEGYELTLGVVPATTTMMMAKMPTSSRSSSRLSG